MTNVIGACFISGNIWATFSILALMEQNKALKEAFQDLSRYIKEVHQKAKHFFSQENWESYPSVIDSNQEDFIITYWDNICGSADYEERTHSLERDVQVNLDNKIYACISEYRFSISVNPNLERVIIDQIDDIFNDEVLSYVKFLSKYRDEFLDKIRKYSDISVETDYSKIASKILAYNPLNINRTNFPTVKIRELYQLLINNTTPFIEAEEAEFLNAFSGKEFAVGIKWLVKGKNKKINKHSLFYLIEKLKKQNFIENPYCAKKILYALFREDNGEHFRNVQGSWSDYTKGQNKKPKPTEPERKTEIDNIISEL
jgi:hypothetical protein